MSNRWELTEQTATELETEAIALQKKHGIAAGALALILLSRDGSKADADMLSERVKVKTTNGKLEPFWAIAAFAQAVAHKPIRKEKKMAAIVKLFIGAYLLCVVVPVLVNIAQAIYKP